MAIKKKPYSDMVRDGIRYLTQNSEITYFGEGSIAKALVEATALEISRLQDYISNVSESSFLSTASGIYLDMFGEMLGAKRKTTSVASSSASDGSVKFYVTSGTLGSYLPSSNPTRGVVPYGTIIRNRGGDVEFVVTESTEFPINSKSVFVPVAAASTGTGSNIGPNQLVAHSLNIQEVKVTNDKSITNASDLESDVDYRYRLSKIMTAKSGANRTAIQIAASSQPGVVSSRVIEYARGTGTFDVLLVPKGNKLSLDTLRDTERLLEEIAAFGISPRVREPEYIRFKIVVQLRFTQYAGESEKETARQAAQSSLLNYMGNIPLGGEMIVNQIRAAIISSSEYIADMKILEICLDGKQRAIRNITLLEDEIFIPDDKAQDPVQIL